MSGRATDGVSGMDGRVLDLRAQPEIVSPSPSSTSTTTSTTTTTAATAATGGASGYDDVTEADDVGAMTSQYTFEERVSIGVVLSVIIFFSIAGNVLVSVAIVTERSLRKTGNYFIISLAIADMLVAILVMTFAVANDIMGYWVFGGAFCDVWISSDVMCSTASILNLCAISLDRYIHIRSPLHYERWVTRRRTLLAITFVWILSALISFLPIHLGWHELGLDRPDADDPDRGRRRSGNGTGAGAVRRPEAELTCMLELNPLYATFSSMVSFYIPCIVMILIYVKMYQYARMHVKSIRKSMAAGGAVDHATDASPPAGGGATGGRHQYKMADHKAAITLGVIMGVFLFCWVPFFTINVIGAFCTTCIPPPVFSVFTWLGYLNSALNPVIYSIFNTEFREAFKRVLTFARWRSAAAAGGARYCGRERRRRRWRRAGAGGRRHAADAHAYSFEKPIRCNGSSPPYAVEYGTVSSTRKLSETRLMADKVTCV